MIKNFFINNSNIKKRETQLDFSLALLPDQGSNLNSPDPESDVLPITPSGSVRRILTAQR